MTRKTDSIRGMKRHKSRALRLLPPIAESCLAAVGVKPFAVQILHKAMMTSCQTCGSFEREEFHIGEEKERNLLLTWSECRR
jgi:hypothetical protein